MPSIRLSESETVVPRGHRKITWFVGDKDHFQPATTWPGAVVEDKEPGPGTIWERLIGLSVDVGCLLMKVDSRPADRPARDVLDYLQRETRRAERETHRSYFRVDPTGRLTRSQAERRNSQRPRTHQGSRPRE